MTLLRYVCAHCGVFATADEAVRGIVLQARQARSLLAEVALWDSGALQGEAARTLLDRVREYLT